MNDNDKILRSINPQAEVELGIDAKRRADNCMVDIQNALKKWKCVIDPVVQISGSGISRSYAIIPLVERPVG